MQFVTWSLKVTWNWCCFTFISALGAYSGAAGTAALAVEAGNLERNRVRYGNRNCYGHLQYPVLVYHPGSSFTLFCGGKAENSSLSGRKRARNFPI